MKMVRAGEGFLRVVKGRVRVFLVAISVARVDLQGLTLQHRKGAVAEEDNSSLGIVLVLEVLELSS